jgi:diphosphomevalonate decarboxylase
MINCSKNLNQTSRRTSFLIVATHRAPSNIALVKYWGKYDPQIPANPSISFTLSKAFTDTTVFFEPSKSPEINLKFEGEAKPSFIPKIQSFVDRIESLLSLFERL